MRLSDLVGPDLAAQIPEVSLPDEVKSGQVADTRLPEVRGGVPIFAFVYPALLPSLIRFSLYVVKFLCTEVR